MNHSHSFMTFIWNDISNRRLLLWGLGLSILQFIVFKLAYPFPDFISDSYYYLFAANAHLNVSIWPIGYSKFLDIFHHLTYSDTTLIGFQYFLMQLSVCYFMFSILYFFNINRSTKNILFIFFFVNPLTLYICNTINSDALFGALSLFWFTELIWVIERPRIHHVVTQAILLFFCFTVRNNAYYYPIIAILAFLLSRQTIKYKIAGIVLPLIFIVPFIINTQKESYKLTGVRQFSLFTGWQLANNALYIYDQIEVDSTELPTSEARQLNRITIAFLKHTRPETYREYLQSFEGNFFLRYPKSPLKQYFKRNYNPANQLNIVKDWGKASAAFEPFGKYLITHHPIAYARYFIWPNVWHYFMPPLLNLELYNYGSNEIDPIAKDWFRYPNIQVHSISPHLQEFLIFYEGLFLLLNIYFIWQLIQYFRKLHLFVLKDNIHSIFWISTGFLLCNFGFTVFSTVNIIRYQYIPMFVLIVLGGIMSDFLSNYNSMQKISTTLTNRNLTLENQP